MFSLFGVEKRKEGARDAALADGGQPQDVGAVIAQILAGLDPERVREVLIRAAKGEIQVEPCFWFYIIVVMGRRAKEELRTSIPKCVVCEAMRRIVLDSIDPSRRNWISLDRPANLVLQYAKRHKCQYSEADRRMVVQHARIISAYTREWVRALADGVNGLAEYLSVSQSVLYDYLSKLKCCK